ncbi:MAG: hypothetical protein V4722_09665 [Bacteroidota bacterium]
MRSFKGLLIVFLTVAGYLAIREWLDRKKEKAQDIEIVREAEEMLGSWANKSKEALVQFRLHRDGKFTYSLVDYQKNDTTRITGKYEVIYGNSTTYYPRLIATDDKNDTVFNYFIAYVTPYDAYALNRGYDKLMLNPNNFYDTVSYTFYRVK